MNNQSYCKVRIFPIGNGTELLYVYGIDMQKQDFGTEGVTR